MDQQRDDGDDDSSGITDVLDRDPRPPIDSLPNDVLVYLIDAYIDDRSLGACLLAWRRFHVFDRCALFRRKYRWATLFSLCAAGDWDGLVYALERPRTFGALDAPAWSSCMFASKGAAHARMIAAGATFLQGVSWTLDFDLWFDLLAVSARNGHQDAVDWLCRRGGCRPRPWGDNDVAHACAAVIRADRDGAQMTLDRIFSGMQAAGDRRAREQQRAWMAAAAACRDLAPRPRPCLDAAALVAAVEDALCLESNSEYGVRERDVESIDKLVANGHLRLLTDIVGPDTLVACLRHIQSRPADPDDALWFYEHVDRPARRSTEAICHLLHVASCAGRVDLLERVETALGALASDPWCIRSAFFCAFDTAARLGHAPFIERVLDHPLSTDVMRHFFDSRNSVFGHGGDAAAPLLVHRRRLDLVAVLLDRRPRRGILQADVDLRVDWTIATAVESASLAGDLAAVRWLHSLAPLLVSGLIDVLRGLRDPTRLVVCNLRDDLEDDRLDPVDGDGDDNDDTGTAHGDWSDGIG
nr:hypothetical protein [Pandoravirus belohorizontensis]